MQLIIGKKRETSGFMEREREEGGRGEKERERWREGREGSLTRKTLILNDSSVRSIWTYVTASPAILQTQINRIIPRTNIISTIKQLINVVSQFLQTLELNFFHGHTMYTTLLIF